MSRDLDVRLALALGWEWHPTPEGFELLCPPGGEGYVYDPGNGAYQLVPRWSTSWQDAGLLLAEWATRVSVTLMAINPASRDWMCDVTGVVVDGVMLKR